ncbi:DUF4082 domain-containing protein [Streptosporangium carneum]|uniref:Ig-like domain-containing protein n=1 Tax=Streptosporangium carneum TaxID=47481 RepID=A0A9W6MHL1_9ACTN|nr:DUF4082 domain-containing protein [Streptosporangium carneum]GLK14351.1 hypothetical protein GCM10017600_77630 [Streptosporangium carneum]
MRALRLLGTWLVAVAVATTTVLAPTASSASARNVDPCGPGGNPIVCENGKTGSPRSEWDRNLTRGDTIEGFATEISVNLGETVRFKIRTPATGYRLDIYRMGYYNGDGARKVDTVLPSATLPQTQPPCPTDANTGLIECGGWAESASWHVPADFVSGVYFAHLVRTDEGEDGDDNHIVFVVRDDASHSQMLFQTSDTTWQAYNDWGGNSTYGGNSAIAPGRAVKVSYNRPFATRTGTPWGRDFVFANEYPMIRFLEANGYPVSYTSGVDTDRRGNLLANHQVFLSVGHDEYWSKQQRLNVEAARDAGMHLAFFSGNEVFWKIRWENSTDGAGTPYRTLVVYKETKANNKIDPSSQWTGTWRDPRFSPPADGGNPENSLTGQFWTVNCCSNDMKVPPADGRMRLWRGTQVAANSAANQTTTLPEGVLGYEWDEDPDNGHRPDGLFRMSTTTHIVPQKIQDFGSTVAQDEATHHLTMYRAPSGALVFGAGTVQWSWGLDDNHDAYDTVPTDPSMRQATVNLLADMGVQPGSLQGGLTAATASADTVAPTATITAPAAGAALNNGDTVTIQGTAADTGGGRVAGVEVSTDGATWHPATGRESWTYTWRVSGQGNVTIRVRAVDDNGRLNGTPTTRAVSVSCPCGLFAEDFVPKNAADVSKVPHELGVRFTSTTSGWISGVQFYKGTGNTGNTVSLWDATSGDRLATASLDAANPVPDGWVTVDFYEPVQIAANTAYVASYYAPNGRFATDPEWFQYKATVNGPLTGPRNAANVPNGVYLKSESGFPSQTYNGASYGVDVSFSLVKPPDVRAPRPLSSTPFTGASSIPVTAKPTITFNEQVNSAQVVVKDASQMTVAGTAAMDAAGKVLTFTPNAPLSPGVLYTVSVSGAKDAANNVMTAYSYSFTTAKASTAGVCPCSLWADDVQPPIMGVEDGTAVAGDGVELGMRFTPTKNGFITGMRFFKSRNNKGAHVGAIWNAANNKIGELTFQGESTEGWQEASFSGPIQVVANQVYTVGYHTTTGWYSAHYSGFVNPVTRGPLRALAHDPGNGGNGVYSYGAHQRPTTGKGTNYFVDVVYMPEPDTTPPDPSGTPGNNATNVPVSAKPVVTFDEPVAPGSPQVQVTGPGGAVTGAVQLDAQRKVLTFTPAAALAAATVYQVTVSGAVDDSGNVMAAPKSWSFTTSGLTACPCTLWASDAAPAVPAINETAAVNVGTKFTVTTSGYIGGLRFYQGPGNTGTHKGSLWKENGELLSSATFVDTGSTDPWKTITFPGAVAVQPGTTYIVSYHAPNGGYALNSGYFTAAATPMVNGPLSASVSAGVYAYGSWQMPDRTYGGSNYWVDPVFVTSPGTDTIPPGVNNTDPLDGESSVPLGFAPKVTFNEDVQPSTLGLTLTAGNTPIQGTVSYDAPTRTATFTPGSPLPANTPITVKAEGVKDLAGNTMPTEQLTFTTAKAVGAGCPCSVWSDAARPVLRANSDTLPVEVGMKFRSDVSGWVTGVRFYKGPGNTGTHLGRLWKADGSQMATGTFQGETTAGWQELVFPIPQQIDANTTYVVSYYAPNGRYASTGGAFASAGVDTPPLHALQAGIDGPNGVYRYGAGGGFPNGNSTANYWVDVVFTTQSP